MRKANMEGHCGEITLACFLKRPAAAAPPPSINAADGYLVVTSGKDMTTRIWGLQDESVGKAGTRFIVTTYKMLHKISGHALGFGRVDSLAALSAADSWAASNEPLGSNRRKCFAMQAKEERLQERMAHGVDSLLVSDYDWQSPMASDES